MKIFKKIITIIACLTLVITSAFVILPKNKSASAYDNTYNYTGSLNSDNYNLGDYAVTSVESISYYSNYVFKITIDTTKLDSDYLFLKTFVGSSSDYSDEMFSFCFQVSFPYGSSSDYRLNGSICAMSTGSNISFARRRIAGYNNFYIKKNSGVCFLFYSSSSNSYLSSYNTFIPSNVYVQSVPYYHSNFSDVLDMNSNTNFSFSSNNFGDVYNSTYYSLSRLFYLKYSSDILNETSNLIYNNLTSVSSEFYNNGGENFFTEDNQPYSCSYFNSSSSSVGYATQKYIVFIDLSFSSKSSIGVRFKNFDFVINRPTVRVNNTLCIFNFDYSSFSSSISSLTYSFSKNNDEYIVNYNGPIPNDKFVFIYNSDIQKYLFDNYIHVSFNFPDKFIYSDDYINTDTYPDEQFNILPLFSYGFDFNFTYYAEPLVSSNSSYNYTFEKPSYVDGSIKFSVVQSKLEIPVLAWVENIFIFLCFYCPIISNLISLIHLDMFIGGLLNVMHLYIDSGIGNFVLSCFAFLIFFYVVKSLFPALISAGGGIVKDVYSNSQFAYNRKRKKEEKYQKKLQKKENRYINKITYKRMKKVQKYNKSIDKGKGHSLRK